VAAEAQHLAGFGGVRREDGQIAGAGEHGGGHDAVLGRGQG
jgi:hypothetical protein